MPVADQDNFFQLKTSVTLHPEDCKLLQGMQWLSQRNCKAMTARLLLLLVELHSLLLFHALLRLASQVPSETRARY